MNSLPISISTRPYVAIVGRKVPNAHPVNCSNECPYGKDRAFCFPCMNKIMQEHRGGCGV